MAFILQKSVNEFLCNVSGRDCKITVAYYAWLKVFRYSQADVAYCTQETVQHCTGALDKPVSREQPS